MQHVVFADFLKDGAPGRAISIFVPEAFPGITAFRLRHSPQQHAKPVWTVLFPRRTESGISGDLRFG